MASFKNPNLQRLINELERYPVDDNEILKSVDEASNQASEYDKSSDYSSSNGKHNGADMSIAESKPNMNNEMRSASAHPSIPMLPSKETLAYARRISEKLGNVKIDGNGNGSEGTGQALQLLTLSSSGPGVHRNHTNYSSIGSGNLASESGTSHIQSPGTEHDERIDTSHTSVAPPRNENRPKSQLYLSDEMEYNNETVVDPPSITLHDVDTQKTTVMIAGKYQEEEEDVPDNSSNTYLQRPVPEEPMVSDDISNTSSIDQQQQQNINTLSQLVSITNDTTVATEFDQLEIPKDERILLEQFIDALSRLTADLLIDPSRRLESLRRLRSAARALEGF